MKSYQFHYPFWLWCDKTDQVESYTTQILTPPVNSASPCLTVRAESTISLCLNTKPHKTLSLFSLSFPHSPQASRRDCCLLLYGGTCPSFFWGTGKRAAQPSSTQQVLADHAGGWKGGWSVSLPLSSARRRVFLVLVRLSAPTKVMSVGSLQQLGKIPTNRIFPQTPYNICKFDK